MESDPAEKYMWGAFRVLEYCDEFLEWLFFTILLGASVWRLLFSLFFRLVKIKLDKYHATTNLLGAIKTKFMQHLIQKFVTIIGRQDIPK